MQVHVTVIWQIIVLQKMLLYYWPVTIVLSVSVANVVSEPQVTEPGKTIIIYYCLLWLLM